MGLQRIRHDVETKQQQTLSNEEYYTSEIQRGAIGMSLLLGVRCNNLFFNLEISWHDPHHLTHENVAEVKDSKFFVRFISPSDLQTSYQ